MIKNTYICDICLNEFPACENMGDEPIETVDYLTPEGCDDDIRHLFITKSENDSFCSEATEAELCCACFTSIGEFIKTLRKNNTG